MSATIDPVWHAGGSALRALVDARPPGTITSPERSIVARWPLLLVAVVAFVLTFGFSRDPQLISVGYAVVVALPVLLARRYPGLAVVLTVLVVAGSTIVALVVSPGAVQPPWFLNLVATHVAIGYVAGLALRLRTLCWMFVVLVACGAVHAVLLYGPTPAGAVTLFSWAGVIATATLLGTRHRDRHEHLLAAMDEAGHRRVREEHDRVARELHDSVAHHLSELAVRAASAPRRLPDVSGSAAAKFTDLGALARGALTEMRSLLGVLRGDGAPDLAPQPGLADVDELVAAARRSGSPVELAVTEPAALPPGTAVSAYRIVQEALSNVVRHATGAPTTVVVGPDGSTLRIRVTNRPVAAAPQPAPGSGLGLIGMRERVRLLRGRADIGPTPDGGFAVDVRLPLETQP